MDVLNSFVNLIPISLLQGLIYAFVALGIMIPFRMLSFPDLTAEGSFPLGASVCAALIAAGADPVAATLAAVASGALAGCATALIHLKLRLNTLLAGIIVVTMLFSINIRIMGKPNTALFAFDDLFGALLGARAGDVLAQAGVVLVLVALTAAALLWFLRTQLGMALRAVGANLVMARAQGLNTWAYTIAGVGLAGALSASAGALMAQNQRFADVNMGFGVLVNGLAAVIIGETLVGRESLGRQVLAPVVGAVVYYQVVSLALSLGLQPSDLKFLTGAFVLATLSLPMLKGAVLRGR